VASSITVNGNPSTSQAALKMMAKIQLLPVDTHGRIARGTLPFDLFMEMPLGLKYVTKPGKYYIGYAHNFILVDLAVGEDKVINLSAMSIPKTDGHSKVKVYTDLTLPEEQDKDVLFYWLSPNNFTFNVNIDAGGGHKYSWVENTPEVDVCRKANLLATGKKYCTALLGDDYKAMAPFYKFAPDATTSVYGMTIQRSGLQTVAYKQLADVWQKSPRILVAEGTDGDTLAVTPGTYIVETTDASGHVTTQSHVEAH
jgi:hypothetical protein